MLRVTGKYSDCDFFSLLVTFVRLLMRYSAISLSWLQCSCPMNRSFNAYVALTRQNKALSPNELSA